MTVQQRRGSLVELRVLEGANLYFPRPAIKLTLDLTPLFEMTEVHACEVVDDLGLVPCRPGPPGTGLRQRFAAQVVAQLVRLIAAESGTTRLAVRSRPVADLHRLVVAYPWRNRGRAETLGRVVARVLDGLPVGGLADAVRRAADEVRSAEPQPAPVTPAPRPPVITVTGANGKATTTRLLARMGDAAGLCVGWSASDGVYVDGDPLGEGAGPTGVARVLDDARVQLAVAESPRGGALRELDPPRNDVVVVTDVSAGGFGAQGDDAVDQLAEARAVVGRVTGADGWVVVGGDDPRTFGLRLGTPARAVAFSADPQAASLRLALSEGGRAVTVVEGAIAALELGGEPDRLLPVADAPITLDGISRTGLECALAATAAGLAVGLPRDAVVAALRTFRPGPRTSPGAMNVYDVAGVTVVVDRSDNLPGRQALLEVLHGLCAPTRMVRLVLPGHDDGADDAVRELGEPGSGGADQVVVAPPQHHPGGRDASAIEGLRTLLASSAPGDAIGILCDDEQPAVDGWLRARGATVDGPGEIRAKARRGRA